jgi:hypothetical protein
VLSFKELHAVTSRILGASRQKRLEASSFPYNQLSLVINGAGEESDSTSALTLMSPRPIRLSAN